MFCMWNRRKCIYFCTKIEEISFPEAVAKVAQMIGYPLEISTNGFEPKPNVNQPYYDVMNDYIAYTQYELNAATGMACLNIVIDEISTKISLSDSKSGMLQHRKSPTII